MLFKKFLETIGVSAGKNEVCESIDKLLERYAEGTTASIKKVKDAYENTQLSSSFAKEFEKDLQAGKAQDKTLVTLIDRANDNAVVLLGKMRSTSQHLFQSREATAGMSFQKANYLRVIASLTFLEQYTARLLDYVLACENDALAKTSTEKDFSVPERGFLLQLKPSFQCIVRALNEDLDQLITRMAHVPDVAITEVTESVLSETVGANKLDPMGLDSAFSLGNVAWAVADGAMTVVSKLAGSVRNNPFYLIGLANAHQQAEEFEACITQAKVIEARLIQLTSSRTGTPDAALEKRISTMAERLTTLRFKIDTMREKYDVRL